jgi:hypothetical protein
LPAEIGLRLADRIGQRRRLDRERRLTGAMLVTGVIADGLDETHIE